MEDNILEFKNSFKFYKSVGFMQVILGCTGGAGKALLRNLKDQNDDIVGVSRDGYSEKWFDGRKGDVMDYGSLVETIKGADIVYNCVNFRYDQWFEYLPKATENIIEACGVTGSRLVVIDNLYMYDPDHIGNLQEDTPISPQTKKGKLRADIADKYLKAHKEGKCDVLLLRGSDFYGPGIVNAVMGEAVFEALANGKKAYLLGNPDAYHTFTFIDDLAKAAIGLGKDINAYGEVWNAPNAPAVTQREFLAMIASEFGTKARFRKVGNFMLRIAGLFDPVMREVREMLYQFENDFIVDDTKIRAMGYDATPLSKGIALTADWFKRKHLLNF